MNDGDMAQPRYGSRFLAAPISRRRALAGAGASAAAAAAWAAGACGGSGSKSAHGPATPTPRAGGTLRTGTTLPLSSGLDPQLETGAGLQIFPRLYGYLLHVDPSDDATIYDHALSVEQPDATTLIVHLRPDVRFHDIAPVRGRAVTAEDAAASLLRYRANQLVLNKTWHTQVLDSVAVFDPGTLWITTTLPNIYSLSELGGISGGAIIPRELADLATDLSVTGVGSGPFQIDHASLNDSVRIVRHGAYFRAPLPYLDAMEWTIFADDAARVEALKQQQVDVVANHDRAEAQQIAAALPDVDITSELSLAYLSLGLRVDRPPFIDPRVREAIDIGLDRDVMIRDITFGEGDILGPVNPHIAGGYWSLQRAEIVAAQRGDVPVDQRRADARAMLERAGAAGAHIRLQVAKVPQLLDVASVVREQLQRLGLIVDLETIDLLPWFLGFRRGEFEMTLISHLPYEWPDAPTRMYHSAGVDGTHSPFGFGDAAIDRLLEQSWGEPDRAVRRHTLLEAQRLMLNARPMIQLFTNKAYTSSWRYVQGRKPGLTGSLAQYNYEQWLDRR
jgi:peptide/nickel transport system substrate-binding protein/glutathione transport system substrate-binding protein